MTGFLLSLNYSQSMGRMRDLQEKQVINMEALKKYENGQTSDSISLTHLFLRNFFRNAHTLNEIAAFFLFLNGATLCIFYGYIVWHDKRAQKRIQQGLCPRCGYDLTANQSGTCPECGLPLIMKNEPR